VSPGAALAAKPAANETSPLTAAGAGEDGADAAAPKAGSCLARAFAASAGRPTNSNDLASNSQSAGVPPPFASRASSEGMARSMVAAAGFELGPAVSPEPADGPVASPNTFAALPKAPPEGVLPVVAVLAGFAVLAEGGEGRSAMSG